MMKFISCNSILPLAIVSVSTYTNALTTVVNDADTSSAASDQYFVPSKASNFPDPIIEPTCFQPSQLQHEAELDDCTKAADMYKRDPFYSISIAYEKNPFPGVFGRSVPIRFRYGSCGIVIDAPPEADVDIFTLESGWSLLSEIITKCIIEAKPRFKFGGCAPIGNLRGFFVAIGGRPRDSRALNSTIETREADMIDAPARYCGKLAKSNIETS